MNFDLFSAVVQMIIAFFALLISVLEIDKARKARAEEKLIVKIEADIVQAIDSIGFENEVRALLNPEYTDEYMKHYVENVNELINKYLVFCQSLEAPYIQLLKDEKRFSLSYGFERYINAFRNFLSYRDSLVSYRKPIEDLSEVNEALKQNLPVRHFIWNQVGLMLQLMDRYPKDVHEIENLYIERRRSEVKDYNEKDTVEQAVMAYFRMYSKVHTVIIQLKERFDEFDPYLDEIKLKFESSAK